MITCERNKISSFKENMHFFAFAIIYILVWFGLLGKVFKNHFKILIYNMLVKLNTLTLPHKSKEVSLLLTF